MHEHSIYILAWKALGVEGLSCRDFLCQFWLASEKAAPFAQMSGPMCGLTFARTLSEDTIAAQDWSEGSGRLLFTRLHVHHIQRVPD